MDTNDAGAESSMENGRGPKNGSCISALTLMSNLNENVVSVGITLGRRKRINDEYNTIRMIGCARVNMDSDRDIRAKVK